MRCVMSPANAESAAQVRIEGHVRRGSGPTHAGRAVLGKLLGGVGSGACGCFKEAADDLAVLGGDVASESRDAGVVGAEPGGCALGGLRGQFYEDVTAVGRVGLPAHPTGMFKAVDQHRDRSGGER